MTYRTLSKRQKVWRYEYDEPPASVLVTEEAREDADRCILPTPDRIVYVGEWMIATDDLRSHEPPRNSGEGTAVNGPMPLGEKDDASAPA